MARKRIDKILINWTDTSGNSLAEENKSSVVQAFDQVIARLNQVIDQVNELVEEREVIDNG